MTQQVTSMLETYPKDLGAGDRATLKACGDECEQHAQMHEHCRVCAEACRRCERACADLLATLG